MNAYKKARDMILEEDIRIEQKDYNKPKNRHVWCVAPPNSGKTTWRLQNMPEDNYEIPLNNDWSGYSG